MAIAPAANVPTVVKTTQQPQEQQQELQKVQPPWAQSNDSLALPKTSSKASPSLAHPDTLPTKKIKFGSQEKCEDCGKTVYFREKLVADGKVT